MSWELMRDIGLSIFAAGGALVVFRFSFSRILLRELGSANVTLMVTIADAMMLAGASLAVTAMAFGYFIPAEAP
jgi:hypothetical protein